MYTDDLLEESRSPANFGRIDNPTVSVEEKNASCGDSIVVDLRFSQVDSQLVISDVKWQGSGCAISQASMSVLTQAIIGKPVSLVRNLTQGNIESLLGLPQPISFGRVKCLMLGLKAIQNAVDTATISTK